MRNPVKFLGDDKWLQAPPTLLPEALLIFSPKTDTTLRKPWIYPEK